MNMHQATAERKSDLPAIFWKESYRQYITYIGFHIAEKGKARGKRARTVHYLGRDQRAATARACEIDRLWDIEVEWWKERDRQCESFLGALKSKPVWRKDAFKRKQAATISDDDHKEILALHPPDPEDIERSKPRLTLAELRRRYQLHLEQRVGLQGRTGLKPATMRTMLMFTTRVATALDNSMNVLEMSREDFRSLVQYWLSPDREISERTAASYLKCFKGMFDWADRESICGYVQPRIKDLFRLGTPKARIQKFDAERCRLLLSRATERCRLFILIGLNTGMNQIDIADLRHGQIQQVGDDWFIVRKRCKTSHQNEFETRHLLWPEAVELIRKHQTSGGPNDFVFKNVHGRPLVHGKTDNIRDSLMEARRRSGVKEISFKQLRKFGVTAIKRISRNSDTARQYAAHVIPGSLAHYDLDDFFDPLTEALKKWREELLANGVIAVAMGEPWEETEA